MDIAGDQIERIPKADRERILNFVYLKLRYLPNPRDQGKPLTGLLKGFWRYRIADYRIVCTIEDDKSLVRIVRVGHRRNVYELEG